MDFSLNDIQQMLQDSAARFVQNDYDFETRQKLVSSELGYSEENWKLFAELGWLALPFSGEYGGMEGGILDVMVLQTELGRGLVVEPYLSTVILGGQLIQRHASDSQKQELLEQVISGELKLAFAAFEPGCHSDIAAIKTTAKEGDGGYRVDGSKAVVLGAPSAGQLLVAARTSGAVGDTSGISLFLVDAKADGVSLHSYPTNDGLRASDVKFENAPGVLLGELGTAHPAIEQTLNDAIVALSAEAVGVMEKLLSGTVEYTKVRKQFDQPIGGFQVLQHKMAEMFMECEQSKSMLYYGAIAVAEGSESATEAAAKLKVKIGSAGRFVGQQAVQLHGGMGVTEELDIGHYFKRITMINTLLGSHDEHLNRLVKCAMAD